MNISETIKALPDGDAKIWGIDIDNCPVEYIGFHNELLSEIREALGK